MDWNLSHWALVILLSPLVGFCIQVAFGRKLPREGDWVPTFFMFVPLCIATWMAWLLVSNPAGVATGDHHWTPELGRNWLGSPGQGASQPVDTLLINFGIHVDNLTIVMLFVVTLVSFLVHVYSMGYMHGEVRYPRFFAYLGLFSFSMLGLCITDNLLFLFIFWELVGLCSYFLIGFYFEKKSAQEASIKAFMTTRIGDLGFFIAILIIGGVVGSLQFDDIFASIAAGPSGPWGDAASMLTASFGGAADPSAGWSLSAAGLVAITGICLLFGPIGKSAQFPLHIWLPDAMEGPTPVSALIHAATMVAAGVYLVARMFPFLAGFEYFQADFTANAPLLLIAVVGGFTAFFAATIAFAQTDIKKVLAYSTISQLGYMFIGLGCGSVTAGIFHLTTHAFFKALLFLGSGSVIHAVHSNEMKDMGGLWKKMPITWATFLVGTLAISGLPILSGFYSKEAILGQAWALTVHSEHSLIYALPFVFGIVTAGMTSFYMFRLFFKTFHGEPRNHHAYEHAHESPPVMTVPLVVLGVLSIVAGGDMWLTGTHEWFGARVNSSILHETGITGEAWDLSVAHQMVEHAHHGHTALMLTSIGLFVGGLALAAVCFLPKGPLYGRDVVRMARLGWLQKGALNLWWVDSILVGFALSVLHGFRLIAGWFDRVVIDGFVNFWATVCRFVTAAVGAVDHYGVDGAVRGLGETSFEGGRWLRRMQSGLLQTYLYASIFLFAGVVLVSVVLLWSHAD